MREIIDNIIKKAVDQAGKMSPEEFKNCHKDESGLYVCSICGKRKQFNFRGRIVRAQCLCDQNQEEHDKAEIKRRKTVMKLYEIGITDRRYLSNTFEKDDLSNPEISQRCRKYVEKWQNMKANGLGILFYGDVGTGKSFMACCIGNELIRQGVPVLITNLTKLVENRVNAVKRGTQPVNLEAFDLLIIDDLGTENATQTAYNVIDDWYRSGKPLIVTTNLRPQELKEAEQVERRRIYDRVVEMCGSIPIYVKGNQRRYALSQKKREIADKFLN